jgi:hypothetical protein
MSDAGLPRMPVIAAALRTTTERLTRELAQPRDAAPDWTEFEWAVARAVSAMHGISSLLATHLRWHGPPAWDEFLHQQREQTLACYDRIGRLLAQLSRAAERAGLPLVALKGSALRQFSLHHPGDRPMGDIDLLVRPGDAELAARVIQSLEYRCAYRARRHDVFMPVDDSVPHAYAEDKRNPLRIELHQRISEPLPVEPVDITELIWPAQVRAGINPYASFAALLRHVALHTCGNMRANAMRFLQIHDCALLARRMGPNDWAELMGPDPRLSAWWLYPALSLAERYVPGSVPANVLAGFAVLCPRRLRQRFDRCEVSEVSWSNLRIAALPGLEWARTVGERLRFARSRIAPSRQALAELQDGLYTLPALADSRWYRGSQLQRILRWTFSHPPRVQTMASIRAALSG